VADAALANSAESAYQRLCSASRVFSRAFLLALIVNDPLSVARLHAQSSQPAIEFINVTAAAGIKFVHFKGNNGISINREEFGPGVCVADFDGDGWQDIYFVMDGIYTIAAFPPAMPCTGIMETAHSPMSLRKPAFQGRATDWVVSGAITTTMAFLIFL